MYILKQVIEVSQKTPFGCTLVYQGVFWLSRNDLGKYDQSGCPGLESDVRWILDGPEPKVGKKMEKELNQEHTLGGLPWWCSG